MINKATLIGRIGKKDVRHTKNGTLMANLSIATNRKWKDSQGENKTLTTWHNVNFYDKLAEIVEAYAEIGNLIYVEGEINNRRIEDGEKEGQYIYSITANTIKLLPSSKKEETKPTNWEGFDDDNVPF